MITLALVLLLPGPRLDAGFETGQRRQGAQTRRINGAYGSVDALWRGRWRASLGYLGRRETPTEVVPGTAQMPGTKTEGPAVGYHQAGLLLGFEHRWVHLAGGLGLRGLTELDQLAWHLRPAARLRLGPRAWVFVDGSIFDPSPWSPGPGEWRVGLGSQPGGSHLWLGWVGAAAGSGLGLAARVPIEGGLHLSISAGMDPSTPGDYLVLRGGVGWTMGAPAAPPPAASPDQPPGPPEPPTPPVKRRPVAPGADPMGVPL